MKKKLLILGIICLTFYSYSHAQSLGDIELSFCENDKTDQVDIVTKSDLDTNICVEYKNNSENDVSLDVNFVDGALNASGGKSCNIPEDQNTNFAKYMQNKSFEVTIKGNSTKKEYYTIHYPVGYEGISHGCLTYNIKDTNEGKNSINFVFRKAFSIDILVGGSQIKPKLNISNIYLTGYDISKQLVMEITNKGNIDQEITLTGIIENIFGYSESFEMSGIIIPSNQKITLTSKELIIPNYKGFFTIKSYLTNNPIFDFDITNTKAGSEYSTAGLTIITNRIMLRNRLYIILIIIIIALITSISINHFHKKTIKK